MLYNDTQAGGSVARPVDLRRRACLKGALGAALAVGGVPALAGGSVDQHGGLVAFYPLDRTSGPVRDVSGGGHDGETLGGVTRGVDGQVNAAFRFDGDDDGVEIPDENGAFDLTAAWSVAAWVYPATGGSNARNDPIVWKIARPGTGRDTFLLGWGVTGANRFRTGLERASDDENFVVDSGTHPPGAWHHVAGVYDGRTLRIYVNGTREGSARIGDVTAYTGRAPLRIGTLLGSGHDLRGVFDGRIDEVRIYGRPLSRGELLVHERLGRCGLSPGELPAEVVEKLVTSADEGTLDTEGDAVAGNLGLPAGSTRFVFANVTGNVDADGSVVVLCGATINGNTEVSDLVAVDARIAGNLQAEETVTALGDVFVNGNLVDRTATAFVPAGSSLRIDGNATVDRLVLGPEAVLSVNGNLNCSTRDVAASADVRVNGINNCT